MGLGEYQSAYGAQVTKDDIFYYVYGLLHSPEYRERYAADLKKQLPRIPKVADRECFEMFVKAGRDPAELYINYEGLEPYPLTETILPGASEDEFERFAVTKMKYAGKAGGLEQGSLLGVCRPRSGRPLLFLLFAICCGGCEKRRLLPQSVLVQGVVLVP